MPPVMSALGQKQTCAVQLGMSALGQKRTCSVPTLLDNLVNALLERQGVGRSRASSQS
jgi:hypothetical protein